MKITEEHVDKALASLKEHVMAILESHGDQSANSRHEVYGILMEEVREYEDEVRSGDGQGMANELRDIAQVCIYGMISTNDLKW